MSEGTFLLRRRDLAAVIAGFSWSIALSAAPDSCTRGQFLFRSKAYPEAQAALWECVLQGVQGTERAHQLALTYRELKNYEPGLERTRAAMAQRGKSADLLYIAAFLHFRMGHHRDSIALLAEAYELDHLDWRTHQLFALNYVVLGIKDGALAEFKNAIALKPENAELHYQLARFYYSESRVAESIEEANRALAIFPEYPEAYDNLGLCYQALGEKQRAGESFERAIALSKKLDRKDEWPYLDFAEFLMKQEDVERSIPLLEQALQMNPASAKASYYMGRAMRKLKRNSEARRFLEQALALDAGDPAPYYELAMLFSREGDRARAKPLFERFEALRKRSPDPNAGRLK